jgi:hypothetical protein
MMLKGVAADPSTSPISPNHLPAFFFILRRYTNMGSLKKRLALREIFADAKKQSGTLQHASLRQGMMAVMEV